MESRRAMLAWVGGAAALLAGCKPKASAGEEPLTPEGKAYVRNLKFSEVGMRATESYAKQVITEIGGKITNAGAQTVDYAEVTCVFYDSMNQFVLRERTAIIKQPLKPGETRAFRLPFDNLPESWNNQMPQLVIARIRLS